MRRVINRDSLTEFKSSLEAAKKTSYFSGGWLILREGAWACQQCGYESINVEWMSTGSLQSKINAYAVCCLSRREYSQSELRQKLGQKFKNYSEIKILLVLIDQVLADLREKNYLSDLRFANSMLHRRMQQQGINRIKNELKQKVTPDTLAALAPVLAEVQATEYQRALSVWQKKFGVVAQTSFEKAKQMRFLTARGFDYTLSLKIINGT